MTEHDQAEVERVATPQEVLTDLARVKVLFQQRAIAAIIHGQPAHLMREQQGGQG